MSLTIQEALSDIIESLPKYELSEIQDILEDISNRYHKSKDRADRKLYKKGYESIAAHYNSRVPKKIYNDTL